MGFSDCVGSLKENKRPFDSNMDENKDLLNAYCSATASSSSSCSSSVDKRPKISNDCQLHKKRIRNTDKLMREAIRKWQLCNLAKCVFDNTVNLVLENIPTNDESRREITLNIASQNYNVENEAVLMAIEEHGLKQPGSKCSCDESGDEFSEVESCSSGSCSSSVSTADFYVQRSTLSSDFSVNSQEYSFENNFMTTAVSAAIEEKGLSMYHVR